MELGDRDDLGRVPPGGREDDAAYLAGYQGVMRELAWARRHGWRPTDRQLVLAITHAQRVYTTARGGKFIGGQRPEWLHGRADAMRALLRQGVGAFPDGEMPAD